MARLIKDPGQEELLKRITSFLTNACIPYMVTGAVSVIFYGRPRASHDIDFVIEAKLDDIGRITQAFTSLPHKEFLVQTTAIKDAIIRKNIFQVLHLPTMLKFDFWILKDNPFDQERFKRRKTEKVFGQEIVFTSPEDTVLKKILWYRESKIEKHLIDAAFVYRIQKDELDERYMKLWAKKQKTTRLLNQLGKIDLEQYY